MLNPNSLEEHLVTDVLQLGRDVQAAHAVEQPPVRPQLPLDESADDVIGDLAELGDQLGLVGFPVHDRSNEV